MGVPVAGLGLRLPVRVRAVAGGLPGPLAAARRRRDAAGRGARRERVGPAQGRAAARAGERDPAGVAAVADRVPGDAELRAELLALAAHVVDRDALRRHYLHVALGQRDRWWSDREVPLKKVFYAVRPAATLRWLRVRPDVAVPPMDLATLLVEGEVPDDVVGAASDLVALKAVSREMGAGAVPVPLVRFVSDELALASSAGDQRDGDRATARAVAAACFRDLVARCGPSDAAPVAPGPGAVRPAPAAGR